MAENKTGIVITVAEPDWNEQTMMDWKFKELITLECTDIQNEASTSVENQQDSVDELESESHIKLEVHPGQKSFKHATKRTGRGKKRKRNKNFLCPYCDYRDDSKFKLESHIRYHTGERPFCCDFCNRSFATKGVLDLHIRTHTKQYPYFCCKCGGSFICNTACVKHQAKEHGMVGNEVNMMFLKEDVSHLGEEHLIIKVKRNGQFHRGKFRFIKDLSISS